MSTNFRSPRKVARRFKYLPQIAGNVKNWPQFMYNYAWGVTPLDSYVFRNGAKLKLGRAIDHVPIIEIFFHKDYGDMPDNSVIVDLGANIGTFSIYAASTARNVKIYAYEALEAFYKLMVENVRANNCEQSIECFNYAVAGDTNTRTLFVESTNFFFPTLVDSEAKGMQKSIEVRCITLAGIFESNKIETIDMLKIDCEGAEYEILYNTPRAYFARINEIRMEYHNLEAEGRSNVEGLKSFLSEQGFRITFTKANTPTNGTLWASRLSS